MSRLRNRNDKTKEAEMITGKDATPEQLQAIMDTAEKAPLSDWAVGWLVHFMDGNTGLEFTDIPWLIGWMKDYPREFEFKPAARSISFRVVYRMLLPADAGFLLTIGSFQFAAGNIGAGILMYVLSMLIFLVAFKVPSALKRRANTDHLSDLRDSWDDILRTASGLLWVCRRL